jgi:hypothetical protein
MLYLETIRDLSVIDNIDSQWLEQNYSVHEIARAAGREKDLHKLATCDPDPANPEPYDQNFVPEFVPQILEQIRRAPHPWP